MRTKCLAAGMLLFSSFFPVGSAAEVETAHGNILRVLYNAPACLETRLDKEARYIPYRRAGEHKLYLWVDDHVTIHTTDESQHYFWAFMGGWGMNGDLVLDQDAIYYWKESLYYSAYLGGASRMKCSDDPRGCKNWANAMLAILGAARDGLIEDANAAFNRKAVECMIQAVNAGRDFYAGR
jgi:hypothetical protein